MDAVVEKRQEEKQQLLRRLTELMVEEQREQGVYQKVPRYSELERAARALAEELARQAQERSAREVAAGCGSKAACPTCGEEHPVRLEKRTLTSLDGPVELVEAVADCRPCRRSFFPSA